MSSATSSSGTRSGVSSRSPRSAPAWPASRADARTRMRWPSFVKRDLLGVRFAVNVFIASAILWYLLRQVAETNPIWSIASMVAASEPQVREAARMFRSRMINVVVGCAVGLVFLLVGGSSEGKLPLALPVTGLVSAYVLHVP